MGSVSRSGAGPDTPKLEPGGCPGVASKRPRKIEPGQRGPEDYEPARVLFLASEAWTQAGTERGEGELLESRSHSEAAQKAAQVSDAKGSRNSFHS